jgi:hypothetical protein
LANVPPLDELGRNPAVALFVDRATSVRPDFALAPDNAPAVAAICARLDGLPLALELAASRTKGLPLLVLLARLSDRLELLQAGAADLVARWSDAAVINAGDGKHEHPSQALLDVYTLRRRLGSLEGKRIWIVGDVLHSRVARSNVLAFRMMGADVTVCGPPTLIPRGIERALGCAVSYELDGLDEADVVYALRMQRERMRESFVPSIREYAAHYQIDSRRLSPRQLLMHPGPVNRGVELSGEVIDGPNSLVTEQVESGLVVRMAILYELLTGGRPRTGVGSGSDDVTDPTPIKEPA